MFNFNLIKEIFENKMQMNVSAIRKFENVPNNNVFKIETESQRFIFKVYSSRNWPEDGKLPYIYRKLTEHNIPHAQLFAFNREDENFPNGYLIEECLSGTTADRLNLSEDEIISIFKKLAVLVSQVHKIKMKNFGYTGRGEPAIWTTFSEFMHDVLKDNFVTLISNGFIKETELARINNAIYAKLKQYDIFPSVICHGDLSTKNILVNLNEITLIDWDDAHSLSWIADIARLTFWMRIHYEEHIADRYKKVFLDNYETTYDKNIYSEIEDVLHVWYGLDNLAFFTKGAVCEKVKSLLQISRDKCGI